MSQSFQQISCSKSTEIGSKRIDSNILLVQANMHQAIKGQAASDGVKRCELVMTRSWLEAQAPTHFDTNS